jgi:hypothetical protein
MLNAKSLHKIFPAIIWTTLKSCKHASYKETLPVFVQSLRWSRQQRVQVGQIFEFVELILFLKTYFGGSLAPSIQTVGSLLIPLAGRAGRENDLSIALNGFDKLKHLTNSGIALKNVL